MKKLILVFSFCILQLFYMKAQVGIQWANCYGGSINDMAFCVQQTTDGGYIIAGRTESNDGDVSGYNGGIDCWIVKVDINGNIEWQKCLGGGGMDYATSIQQTTDQGYIVSGTYSSYIDNQWTNNAYVAKLDNSGAVEWEQLMEQCSDGRSIVESSDGGFAFAGFNGNYIWVGKLDNLGNSIWDYYFYGDAFPTCIQQTTDGGYIISGGGDNGMNGSDYLILKIDDSGTEEWYRYLGGADYDYAHSIQQTSDAGYIMAGRTQSNDGDVSGNHGSDDCWIVKVDNLGVIQWQKCFGGSLSEITYSIDQTIDEGYILAGMTKSNDGDVFGLHGGEDYWVYKLNNTGNLEWQECLGGSLDDRAYSICQTTDGNYIVAGSTRSNDGDVIGLHGIEDFWVAKLCIQNPLSIEISDLTYCLSTDLTAIGDFEEYLWNTGETTQSITITNGGYFSVIAYNASGCPTEDYIVAPDPVEPYPNQEICMVTLDQDFEKNLIVVEKNLDVGIDTIKYYRQNNSTGLYDPIGTTSINEEAIFIDDLTNPNQQSQRYKIAIIDTCNKQSSLSIEHRTILLQASTGVGGEVNLLWNPYEGFNYQSFEIYRRIGDGDFNLIAYTPYNTFSYTDLNPPSGDKSYQIRVEKDIPCDPAKKRVSICFI